MEYEETRTNVETAQGTGTLHQQALGVVSQKQRGDPKIILLYKGGGEPLYTFAMHNLHQGVANTYSQWTRGQEVSHAPVHIHIAWLDISANHVI